MNDRRLPTTLETPRFDGYTYSYPHKHAYRPLQTPLRLRDVWADEPKNALFLYVHIPYCGQRCGFCNLFTLSKPDAGAPKAYLNALERQVRVVREGLGDAAFARIAIGGGTPTYLDPTQLQRLFGLLDQELGARPSSLPTSVETSPETATLERLQVLRDVGVNRISMGVQSFSEAENRALGRAQSADEVRAAIATMRRVGFPTVNLDFIYGGRGQTDASWLESLNVAADLAIEELFLYPLYVRALTGLGRSSKAWDDERLRRYTLGRDLLLSRGYRQLSMRMFRRHDHQAIAPDAPVYRCTADGMVGLGAGARSYTSDLHYSSEYAVGRSGVKAILEDFLGRSDDAFATIDYGFRLDADEKRRRTAILGLLSDEGLDGDAYMARFGARPQAHFPQLESLLDHDLAKVDDVRWRLTPAGITRSDVIGPWLYSAGVRSLIQEYELR